MAISISFSLNSQGSRKKEVAAIAKALADEKKKKGIVQDLEFTSLDRSKADVQMWRDALDEWEDEFYPDRYHMQQLYQEIEMDDCVSTHFNTILRKLEGSEFEVGAISGDKFIADEEKTEFFKAEWFNAVVKHILGAEMQGYSLVEVAPLAGDTYNTDSIQLIPRHLVCPEKCFVRKRPTVNIDVIPYTLPEYARRLLMFGDKTDKGLFNNLAVLYIYKKNALAFWANFQSKFGIPPVIAKTDLTNKLTLTTLVEYLQQMRSNSFGVIGTDDTIEGLKGIPTDAFQTFKEMVDHCDSAIARVMEGQNMTSTDGSSRSQAEVHERTSDDWNTARIRRVERVVKSQLMPIIQRDLSGWENVVFRFKEVKDVDKIIDRALKLNQAGYKVEVEYLETATGMPLEAIEAPEPKGTEPNDTDEPKQPKKPIASITEQIEALYTEYLN